jgi:hypothetical protein
VTLFAFPEPPPVVRQVLNTLTILRIGTPAEIEALGDTGDLPRPWLPGSLPAEFQRPVWRWCDDVATWLNSQLAWRPLRLIPGCWPKHPHLVHELPLLACLRGLAERDNAPDRLEEWHRQTLPQFFERLTLALGESTCSSGSHQDWPAASRHHVYCTEKAVAERRDLFELLEYNEKEKP